MYNVLEGFSNFLMNKSIFWYHSNFMKYFLALVSHAFFTCTRCYMKSTGFMLLCEVSAFAFLVLFFHVFHYNYLVYYKILCTVIPISVEAHFEKLILIMIFRGKMKGTAQEYYFLTNL